MNIAELLIALMVAISSRIANHPGAGAASPRCSYSFNDYGYILSPNYPGNYYNNATCQWNLQVAQGKLVVLDFDHFELENGYDFLRVYSQNNYIGKYTGTVFPTQLVLGRDALVQFTSDGSVTKKGFSIRFTSTATANNCGGLVVGNGLIQSPGYPAVYSNGLTCVWGIVASPGKTVVLRFTDFRLRPQGDYLDSYDGWTRAQRYVGSGIPPEVHLGTAGSLIFRSGEIGTFPGFSASFTSEALICGGSLLKDGNITSPSYPYSYPNNARCTWTIAAPGRISYITLTFKDFSLESHDTVQLYDGNTLKETLSGPGLTKNIYYSSPSGASVVFVSDGAGQSRGFRLEVYFRAMIY